jgi:hypothetical protein
MTEKKVNQRTFTKYDITRCQQIKMLQRETQPIHSRFILYKEEFNKQQPGLI